LCPRYVARVIDTLKVTESPEWIKQRLHSVGQRSINNIVDITNFVMIEYGQPLHAFDLRKIETGTIRVAPCKEPMDFTLLTGQTVRLEPGDILILDGDRPIALAGIMGGANTSIEPDTTSIILESAAFYAKQIRRTSKRLGITSESSKRFEKGVDLAGVAFASERAAALLRDGFNANCYHPPIDTNEFGVKEHILSVDMRDIRKCTGMKNLSSDTAADVLESIGITSHKKSVNVLSIRLPSYRLDLRESVDVVEEVARLVGYDLIPENYPTSKSAYDRIDEGTFEFDQRTKNILCSLGLRETIHYSFTSEDLYRKLGLYYQDMIPIQNPISEEMKVLRTTLLPSLLSTYVYNKNRKISDQRLFEVAKVYFQDDAEETRVREMPHAAGLIAGNTFAAGWRKQGEPVDFYFVKGLIEILVRQLTSVYLAYEPARNHALLHPNRSAVLKLGLKEVGCVGEVHPLVRTGFLDSQEPLVMFEINLEALRKYERTQGRYKIPAKYPSIEFDVAVVVDKAVTSYSMVEAIRQAGGTLLGDVSIFDMYEGDNIPMGKRSIAFHLNFLSPERTLLEEEAIALKEKIVQVLNEKFSAQLRM
jgi:phenylalanyl-tRNA synthetase beta chain